MKKHDRLSRRLFLGQSVAAPLVVSLLGMSSKCSAQETGAAVPEPTPMETPETGKPYPGWKEGELDLHFIYTGATESAFHIYPDGTSMLLDTGDWAHDGNTVMLPDTSRRSGEWVARYVQRVNPAGNHVDYMMCSHFHDDHCGGNENYHAGLTTGRGDDYHLSGLAQVAEFIHFDEVFDRSYPDYDAPVTAWRQYETKNWLKFVQYQEKANGLKRTPFVIGRAGQIVLKKAPEKYRGQFQVFNVCGNGTVCLEPPRAEDEFNPDVQVPTENLFVKYPQNNKQGANENLFSIAIRISYGKFRYYSGGDVSGTVLDDDGKDVGLEAIVGRTAGKVTVCKANHHGFIDAMRPEFVREVQAKAYVLNVWHPAHVNKQTVPVMLSRELYPGDRLICPTLYEPRDAEVINAQPWAKEIVKIGGHVVVKVFDGGAKFKIYYLTANDESMTVKAVYGPWDA